VSGRRQRGSRPPARLVPGRRIRRAPLLAALLLLAALPCAAQVVPWLESPLLAGDQSVAAAAAPPASPVRATDAAKNRRRPATTARPVAAAEEAVDQGGARSPFGFAASLAAPSDVLISGFGGGSTDGNVRSGSTWSGQVAQQAGTVGVGGTARDDNGWGATQLSIDASTMTYLNIVAQRDPGHSAKTLFIQFEDLNLQTKVVSVGTAQFAVGSLTLVQVPLTNWTIDFGPSQITGWSIGGGGVGTVDFRMTFDSLAFTATAIPEPATAVAVTGLAALAVAAIRRRANRSRG
jgi:hypothetical protein